jgi:hypothetical protein
MRRALEDATRSGTATLAVLLAGALAVVVSPLLSVREDPLSAAVAVLALALAALLGLGRRGTLPGARPARVALATDDGATRLLSGRVTDPTHHPVRPRAPGSA